MSKTPVLYDLASKGRNACWSPNTWKTRMALNFKGIQYETVFLEMPEVQGTLKELGPTPNEDGLPYTVPTMTFPDGTCAMDSRNIADKIEAMWPDKPSLGLDSQTPSVEKVLEMVHAMVMPIIPVLIPAEVNILSDASLPQFLETREKRFGMPMAQLSEEQGGKDAWLKAKKPMEEVAAMLKSNSGPFIQGKTAFYGDFLIVAFLEWGRRMDKAIYDPFVAVDPAFDELHRACQPWLEKDD